jgi:hypothetical protein
MVSILSSLGLYGELNTERGALFAYRLQ